MADQPFLVVPKLRSSVRNIAPSGFQRAERISVLLTSEQVTTNPHLADALSVQSSLLDSKGHNERSAVRGDARRQESFGRGASVPGNADIVGVVFSRCSCAHDAAAEIIWL